MKFRLFVICSLTILILITSSQSSLSFSNVSQVPKNKTHPSNVGRNQVETDIIRDLSCNKKYAIHMAENINYSSYLDMHRFDYPALWANYIDEEVINHYLLEYSKADNNATAFEENNNHPRANFTWTGTGIMARLNYSAYARCVQDYKIQETFLDLEKWNSSSVFTLDGYESRYETAVITHGVKFTVTDLNKSYHPRFNFSVEFENVTVVYMRLKYDETFGRLGGYYVDTYQKIIFDKDFNVLMMLLYPSRPMVA